MDFLLVHGTTQSADGWRYLVNALAAPGHRSVAVDLRGQSLLAELQESPGQLLHEHLSGHSRMPPATPSLFVLPTADRRPRPTWMRQTARQRLGSDPVEIEAGYCPHVSRPDDVAAVLTTITSTP